MAYSSHLVLPQKKGASSKGSSKGAGKYVRVAHVVTTTTDPLCVNPAYLYGVYYRKPKQLKNEDDPSALAFAFQGNANIRTLPLEGEMVELSDNADAAGLQKGGVAKYWLSILPVWNHPHHNATPDTKQPEWQNNLLGGTKEQRAINPIQANPGDTIFEGRLSQSIRFSGYMGNDPKLIDSSNDGKPIILISNGQIKTDEGNSTIHENINEDYNSLHFLSDHKSDLRAVNMKRDSYDVVPLASNQYIGNQVLINAGRLFFNAKEDSAFISAKESIGLNARTLNLDADEYACIDSKRIYLGSAARMSITKEPTVLGIQLENWLTTLLDTLENVAIAMQNAAAFVDGEAAPITALVAAGPELEAVARSLKTQMILFQSKKVFTE